MDSIRKKAWVVFICLGWLVSLVFVCMWIGWLIEELRDRVNGFVQLSLEAIERQWFGKV